MEKVVGVILLFSYFAFSVHGQTEEFKCPEEEGAFPNPDDCDTWYNCTSGEPVLNTCPGGLKFNPHSLLCDWPTLAGCDTDQDGERIRSKSELLHIPWYRQGRRARNVRCPNEKCHCAWPHETHCAKFYKCTRGKAYVMTCSSGLNFNPEKFTCDYQDAFQCQYKKGKHCCKHHNHHSDETSGHSGSDEDLSKGDTSSSGSRSSRSSGSGESGSHEKSVDSRSSGSGESNSHDKSDGSSSKGSGSSENPGSDSKSNEGGSDELPDVSSGESGEICKNPSDIYPDPDDCHNFYQCSGGIAYINECPANTHFSPIFRVCMDPYKAGCVHFSTLSTGKTQPPTKPTQPTEKPTHPTEKPTKPTEKPTNKPTPTIPTSKLPLTPTLIPTSSIPFVCPSPFGDFPVPGECDHFYHCSDGIADKLQCPKDLHFNPQKRICDWPESAGCQKYETTAETTAAKTTIETTAAPAKFVCPQSQGLFPNSEDCHSFYHCDHNVAYLKECPANLHFNPSLLVCDWPENAGCQMGATVQPPHPDPTDKPTKDEECTCACCIKPDPNDCRKYFRCFNGKAYHSSCSGGLVFNPEIQNCDYKKNVECRDEPNPDEKPKPGYKCPASQGLFANPKDCGSFYHCDHGIAYLKDCPANLHFNPNLLVCDWPENAGCSNRNGTAVIPPPLPTGVPNPGTECHCDCCVRPNPNDCASYYRCQGGHAYVQECPEGLLFNPEINSCDFQSHVQCIPPTIIPPTWFECPTPLGLFPNPVDCGSFFHCSHNIAYLKQCPANLHFNPKLLVCDWPQNAGCIDPSATIRPPLPVNGTCPCTCCLLPDKNDCQGFFRCRDNQLEHFTCGNKLSFNPDTSNCEPTNSFKCTDNRPSKYQCPQSQGLFPHLTDCTKFYQCDHDTAYVKHCPPGLHFNPSLKVCDWPKNAGCKGQELGICSAGDGLYPNPADCTTFYSCSAGTPYLMHCPANLHFNKDRNLCDWPEQAGCQGGGGGHTTPSGSKTSETLPHVSPIPTTPNPGSVFTCPKSNGLFPHPTICTVFYHCSNGIAYLKNCPDGLHFDPKLLVCNWPAQAGCKSAGQLTTNKPKPTGKPTPKPDSFVCPDSNGLFPNPIDCRTFYHCANGKPYKKQCPAELHFNPLLLVCDWPDQAGCGDAPVTPVDVVGSGEEPDDTTVKCPDKSCVCRVPDPKDCAAFYACEEGKAYPRRCPLGLHYNVNTEMCDLPKNVKCK